MAIYTFGSGYLWGVRTDIATPTPRQFGTLQSVSIDFQSTSKNLYGQKQFPVAVGRGTAKLTGKAKMGQIQGSVFGDLFFNTTPTAGRVVAVQGETATIPATGPYTITAANAGLAGVNFVEDLGVVDATTGNPYTVVASSPATGQYTQAAGTYTFAAADEGKKVALSYRYKDTLTGQTITYTNQDLGIQPVFQVVLREQFQAPGGTMQATLTLHAAISEKLSIATKQEDFDIPEFDFSCFADAAGVVFDWSFSDVS
jgi:hypothetical protein